MPKLPVCSARECLRVLQKVGFYISRQTGSHIILYRDDPHGRIVVPNHKEIHRGTLRSIISNADLTVEAFIELLKD